MGGMPSSGTSSRMAAQAWAPPSAPQSPLQPMGGLVLHQGRGHHLHGNKKLQDGGAPEERVVNPLGTRREQWKPHYVFMSALRLPTASEPVSPSLLLLWTDSGLHTQASLDPEAQEPSQSPRNRV